MGNCWSKGNFADDPPVTVPQDDLSHVLTGQERQQRGRERTSAAGNGKDFADPKDPATYTTKKSDKRLPPVATMIQTIPSVLGGPGDSTDQQSEEQAVDGHRGAKGTNRHAVEEEVSKAERTEDVKHEAKPTPLPPPPTPGVEEKAKEDSETDGASVVSNPTPPLATAPVLALGGTNPPTNPTPKHTQPSTSGTVSPTQPQHDRYPTPENPVTENPPTNSGSPTYNDTPASTTKKKVPLKNLLSTLGSITKVLIKIGYGSADVFPPLKAALGGTIVIIEQASQATAVKQKASALLKRIDGVGTLIESPTDDEGEQKRRDDCLSTLNGIVQELELLGEKGTMARFVKGADYLEHITGLLGELENALNDYKLKQQQAMYDQVRRSIDHAELALLERCKPVLTAGYEHGDRRGCLAGTREVVLDAVETWVNGGWESSAIFLLHGLVGTGKSAISQTVAERMFAESLLGASFFCSRAFEDRSDIHRIFPTLAYQLAHKDRGFRSVLVDLLRSDPSIPFQRPLEKQIRKLIAEPLRKSPPASPIFVVIDGLDECGDDEPESSILLALGKLLPEIPSVRFFISTRPERHIMSGIRGPMLKQLTNTFALHNVDPHTTGSDIHRFFKHELLEIAHRNDGLDGWPTDEQLESLCRRAGGLFVCAAATVNFLDSRLHHPSDQLDTIMRSPENTAHEGKTRLKEYTSLDSLYTSIFQAAFRGNDANDDAAVRSILSAVVLAANPLSPSIIATLMGLRCNQVQRLLELIQSMIMLPEDQDPSHPVQPFHVSFPDFITDPARCVDTRFYISPDYHTELVLHCLGTMNKKLKKNMCSIPNHFLNSDVMDLLKGLEGHGICGALKYACGSWYKHLIVTNYRAANVVSALRSLLEKKFLFWLEVSSVLGIVGDAARALDATIRWLGKAREIVDIGNLLHTAKDCLRFVTEFFEVISLSAPHIYHSALALVPRSSMVWELYKQYTPSSGPRVVTGVSGSLDSCTASTVVPVEKCHPTWSQCSQFIAVSRGSSVEILNAIGLETAITLEPPNNHTSNPPCSLAFSPDGRLLACAYSFPAEKPGHDVVHEGAGDSPLCLAIIFWDTQTGIVVKNLDGIQGEEFMRMDYSRDGRTITAIQVNQVFRTYDVRDYRQLCSDALLPPKHAVGALWAEGGSIRYSTRLKTGRQLGIHVHEIRPTSTSPVTELESLRIPFRRGKLFFSPACFHASFVTDTEVIILNVRSPAPVLFETKMAQPQFKLQGRFSPDGRFFACEALTQDICIWENASTRYMPRDPIKPRSKFQNFQFSPNASWILCWDQEIIQLLDPDIRITPPVLRNSVPQPQRRDHMVTHSTSGTHAAIAWRGQSAVIVFDLHSPDTPRPFGIATGMEVQDVKIVGETIFVADTRGLTSWRLEAGVATKGKTTGFGASADVVHRLALSKDCSWVLFVTSRPETQGPSHHLSVRDTRTRNILAESRIDFDVDDIGFFPDGHRVWFVEKHRDVDEDVESYSYGNWVWEIPKGEGSAETKPERTDEWPADCPWTSPPEYYIGDGGRWVMDSGSKLHLLWLPPTWRRGKEWDRRWDGNFLTLLGDRPEPVIIKLSPPSLPLDSSVRLSDTSDPYSPPSDTDDSTRFS